MPSTRLDQFLTFLQQDPDDSFTRYAVGLEYASAGEKEKAIAIFEELTARDRNYVATYYQLAKLYNEVGEPSEAEATYREGIAVANAMGDSHAASELQAAWDEMDEGDEEY